MPSNTSKFRLGLNIAAIDRAGDRITGVRTDFGTLTADKYVVALGSYSPKLLSPIGIDLPVYPVKGYSITVPITDPTRAPESTVMDETHKVAVTRLGNRIRVGGTAQLSGYDLTLNTARRATLEHVVTDLFPHSGDVRRATFWTGLRPMTPDGTRLSAARAIRIFTSARSRYARLDHGRRYRARRRRSAGRSQASNRTDDLGIDATRVRARHAKLGCNGELTAPLQARRILSMPTSRGARHPAAVLRSTSAR